jgi:hypothetical protein
MNRCFGVEEIKEKWNNGHHSQEKAYWYLKCILEIIVVMQDRTCTTGSQFGSQIFSRCPNLNRTSLKILQLFAPQ